MRRVTFLIVVVTVGFAACGPDSGDLCDKIVCEEEWKTCDPADGICKGEPPDPCEGDATCSTQHRECTDDNGTPVCGECVGGYHDEGGECVEDEECLPNSCSGHGQCNDSSGIVTCNCDEGYVGDYCSDCLPGYNPDGDECVQNLCFGVDCGAQHCDPADGGCYDCLNDGHCTGQYCNMDGSCVECLNNAHCDDGDLCNGTEECSDGTCVNGVPVDCGAQHCDPTDGGCYDCLNDGHCTGQYCNMDGACVECLNNAHCDDGDLCNGTEQCSDGTCVNGAPVNCPSDDLVCNGTEECNPANGLCHSISALTCGTNADCYEPAGCDCEPGYQDTNGDGDCLPECPINYCGDHGSCEYNPDDTYHCNCDSNYDGDTCDSCATGYGNYPTCGLNVVVSNVTIDCSGGIWPGHCVASGETYPVTFTATNATNCTGTTEVISGIGTPGTVTNCDLDSCNWTTGNGGNTTIRITITCTGDGDPDSAYDEALQQ